MAGTILTKEYLTIEEMSARSGLSVSTLRRYVVQGKILAYQPGGPGSRLLFPPDALEKPVTDCPTVISAGPAQPKGKAVPLPGPAPRWQKNSRGNN